MTAKKNILLIVVDCARAEKTVIDLPQASPWTRRSARLPFLDRLRRHGTSWTQLIAVSSTTTPNFASMFTGELPVHHGILEHSRHSLRIDVPAVAELLRRYGYHTAAEVTGPLIREAGLARGFAHYRCRDRTEYLHTGLAEQLEALRASLREPWFLCLHLWEAHQPFQTPAPFQALEYGFTPYDRALSFADECLARVFREVDLAATSVIYTGDHGERLEGDYELAHELGGRDAEVLDLYRRFCSEHGGETFPFDAWYACLSQTFGEVWGRIYAHNVLGHGFHLTEDLVRVPLVIADADRCRAGVERDELRSQRDLGATILDLAGITDTGDDRLRGQSLLDPSDEEMVYVEANGSGGRQFTSRCYLRGARSRRWKYWRIEAPRLEHRVLWDLQADPREIQNVAGDYPGICEYMDRFTSASLEDRYVPAPEVLAGPAGDAIERRLRELGYL